MIQSPTAPCQELPSARSFPALAPPSRVVLAPTGARTSYAPVKRLGRAARDRVHACDLCRASQALASVSPTLFGLPRKLISSRSDRHDPCRARRRHRTPRKSPWHIATAAAVPQIIVALGSSKCPLQLADDGQGRLLANAHSQPRAVSRAASSGSLAARDPVIRRLWRGHRALYPRDL